MATDTLVIHLPAKRRAGDSLSKQEQSELKRLTEAADLLTLKKAYRAVPPRLRT